MCLNIQLVLCAGKHNILISLLACLYSIDHKPSVLLPPRSHSSKMKAAKRPAYLKKIHQLTLASCLLIGAPTFAASDTEKASAYYEDALKHYNSERYDEAVIQLKNAFQENPRFLPALVLLGKTYLETGNPAAAETAFSDAIELGADPSLVAIPLANSFLRQFKHDLLLSQTVDETLPDTIEAELHVIRARAALEINNSPVVDQSIAAAERLDPYSAQLLALKATLLMRSGKLKEAQELSVRLTDVYPQSITALLTSASLKHLQGDLEGALEGYSKIIALDPKSHDARIARIGLLMDLNRDANSEGDFTALAESASSDPRISYLRAVSFAKAGDEAASTAALNETLNILDLLGPEIYGRNLQLLMVAGIANYSMNNFESARNHLETYAKASPNELAPQRLLATIYMRTGEYRSAVNILKNMLSLWPDDPQLLNMLAQAYDRAGDHQLSVLTFEKALSQSQDNPALQQQLAISKMSAGNLEQGLEELNNLFFSDESNTASGLALAVTLLNQQKYDEALNVTRKLAEQNPDDIAKQNLLAISLVGLGELAEAKTLLLSILKTAPDNVSVKRNLVKLEIRQQNFAAAKSLLDELLSTNKNDPEIMLEMARYHAAQENLSDALRWAKSAASAAPKSFAINSYLIDLYLQNGDNKEALKVALDQEALHGNNLYVLESQARVLLAAEEKTKLLSLLRQMATEAEFNTQWLFKIAQYQIRANSLDEASYTLFRAIQGNPNHFQSRVLLTEVELQLGRLDQALNHAKQLINDFPQASEGYQLVGDVRMERRQFSHALDSYKNALAVGANSKLVLRVHIAQRFNNEHAKAQATLSNWLVKNPHDLTVKNALAEFYLSTANVKAAADIYRELIATTPSPALYNNLAFALYKLGELNEAINYARKAYKQAPDDPLVNDTLGWLLAENKLPSEGLPFLREAVTRSSDKPEIRYHLAVVLHQLGRNKEALGELKIAIASKLNFEGYTEAVDLLKKLEPEV